MAPKLQSPLRNMVPRYVSGAITLITPMPAPLMASTDPIGCIAACSSASGRGLTGAGAAADTATVVADTHTVAAELLTGLVAGMPAELVDTPVEHAQPTVADIAAA